MWELLWKLNSKFSKIFKNNHSKRIWFKDWIAAYLKDSHLFEDCSTLKRRFFEALSASRSDGQVKLKVSFLMHKCRHMELKVSTHEGQHQKVSTHEGKSVDIYEAESISAKSVNTYMTEKHISKKCRHMKSEVSTHVHQKYSQEPSVDTWVVRCRHMKASDHLSTKVSTPGDQRLYF